MSEKFKPIKREGIHLAPSKNTDGTFLGALLDDETNKVVGQAEWELITDDEAGDTRNIAEYVMFGVGFLWNAAAKLSISASLASSSIS